MLAHAVAGLAVGKAAQCQHAVDVMAVAFLGALLGHQLARLDAPTLDRRQRLRRVTLLLNGNHVAQQHIAHGAVHAVEPSGEIGDRAAALPRVSATSAAAITCPLSESAVPAARARRRPC